MSVEITKLTDDKIKFLLTHTDVSMANALRRIMISETPTIAIEIVQIRTNTSALPDELLSHRLGLVPLQSHQVGQFRYSHVRSIFLKIKDNRNAIVVATMTIVPIVQPY